MIEFYCEKACVIQQQQKIKKVKRDTVWLCLHSDDHRQAVAVDRALKVLG